MRLFLGYGGGVAEAAAIQLRGSLKQEEGWEVVKAPEDIPIGRWEESTLPALKRADVFVVVYCQDSAMSQDLLKEIVLADEYEVEIYPIVERSIDIRNSGFPRILREWNITRFAAEEIQAAYGEIRDRLKQMEAGLVYRRIVEATPE